MTSVLVLEDKSLKTGRLKMHGMKMWHKETCTALKMQDWKMRHKKCKTEKMRDTSI